MRLRDGAQHETVAGQPQQYNISTFTTTDLPARRSARRAMCTWAAWTRPSTPCP